MCNSGMRKYSYTIMLAASFVIAGLFWSGTLELNTNEESASPLIYSENEEPPENENTESSSQPENEQEISQEKEAQEVLQPVIKQADRAYFDDALFIGDSRTMGLYEYGDLGNAAVIADSGMSVYKVWKEEVKSKDKSAETLRTLLEKRTFGKVYVMLGVNELGYAFEPTVDKYRELIEQIEEAQPEAIIYLEANLHITKEKSDSSDIYNNSNINRFNEAVAEMAGEDRRTYLDVNELFDDETGSLSEDYTVDNAHVLGKYYVDWVDWLLERAVFYE